MNAKRFLLCLCVFGLLWGARQVNEALIALRVVTAVQHARQGLPYADGNQRQSIGEVFTTVGLALAATHAPDILDPIADEASHMLLFGIVLMGIAILGVLLLAVFHLRGKRTAGHPGMTPRRRP